MAGINFLLAVEKWGLRLFPPKQLSSICPALDTSFVHFLSSRAKEVEETTYVMRRYNPIKRIRLIETTEQWESFWQEVREEVNETKVVGFDCEWGRGLQPKKICRFCEAEGRKQRRFLDINRPTSLLQLATVGGYCGLVRILKMDSISDTLKALLGDPSILKLGVQPLTDGNRLWKDHG